MSFTLSLHFSGVLAAAFPPQRYKKIPNNQASFGVFFSFGPQFLVDGIHKRNFFVNFRLRQRHILFGLHVPRQRQQVLWTVNSFFVQLLSAHLCRHDVVGRPTDGAPHIAAPTLMSGEYAPCFPEADDVEVFTPRQSYFAYEQLVEVVGG